MRTALVTGATGFIGRHIVAGLLDRGVAVRALVRSPAKAGHLAPDRVERVAGSLADIDAWRAAIGGCDAVFHCAGLVAARRRADLTAVNAAAVGRLADACAAVETPPALVHLSSLAAAGPAARDGIRDEADPVGPVSAYGASKLAGDGELAARAGRLPVTIVRPGIVFGPDDANVTAMFQSIQWTRLHAMMGFRSPRLSLIHVADLVSLVLDAATRGTRLPAAGDACDGGGIYHACDDREFPTHAALGRRMARALGTFAIVLPLPLTVAVPTAFAIETFWNLRGHASIVSPDKIREAVAPSWAASAARARRDLGFAPAASLDERLGETVRWLRENGRL
jgi:nucleoside-diphosphate-sugar epimerase